MDDSIERAAWDLRTFARWAWNGPQATLSEIPVFAAVVLGDIARVARMDIEDSGLGDPDIASAGRELGNLILSSLRWIDDLGLDVTTCLEEAAKSQREYGR